MRQSLVQHIFQSRHSTGVLFCLTSSSLVFEKCLHPKNPLEAENGEGWAALST